MTRRTNKKRGKKGGSGSPLIRASAAAREGDKLALLQGSSYLSPPSSPQFSKTALPKLADIEIGLANNMMNDLVRKKATKGREECYNYCNKEEKDYIQRQLKRYNKEDIIKRMHDNELTWGNHITRNEGIDERKALFERLGSRNPPHSGRKPTNSGRWFGTLIGGKKTRKSNIYKRHTFSSLRFNSP